MYPPRSSGGRQLLELLAQELPAALVLDALRDADVRVLRQVHEEAPGDRDLRREAGALGSDRVLDHLHHDRLPLGEDLLDRARRRGGLAVLALLPDVGDVQERGPLEPDLDERGLHAGQHPHHAAHVDVADDAAARGALDVQLLHHAVRHHRDARFLRRDVDQDLFGHGGRSLTRNQPATAASPRAPSGRALGEPRLELAQQARRLVERQAHHAGVAAEDLGNERGRAALDRVAAGLVVGLAGRDVVQDLAVARARGTAPRSRSR